MKITRDQIAPLAKSLVNSVVVAVDRLSEMRRSQSPVELLMALRFDQCFPAAESGSRNTNFQELLNQATTSLVQLAGCSLLFHEHPVLSTLELAWQEKSGWDISSADQGIVAECYAARARTSNDKHKDDLQKLQGSTASHRYLFYYAVRGVRAQEQIGGVEVRWVDLPAQLHAWVSAP